ncbi:helix-turn-helix domain-containing protein [Nitrosococcus wardiae]|nr:helix-turn-helix domain-containing protein [Nitrosococcus wardiae]
MTQQELAELAGASRPVVSLVLNEWRRNGIVSYTRQFICIDDMDSLKQIAS